MKLSNKFTAIFLVAGLLLGLAAPVAAQDNTSTEFKANAETSTDSGIMKALSNIQEKLSDIQERLTNLEDKVDSIEANVSADSEADPSDNSNRHGPPKKAQNNNGNGAGKEVSEAAKKGDKEGIFKAIGNFLSGNGNNEAANAVASSEGENKENESEVEAEAEAEEESKEDKKSEKENNPGGQAEASANASIDLS